MTIRISPAGLLLYLGGERSRWMRAKFLIPALIAIVASAGFYSMGAFAAFDQAVTWEDMSSLDLRAIFDSQYASRSNLMEPMITESDIELALRDADSRISPEFRIPPGMRETVSFWLRIYTEYTTQHTLIFDEQHPSIVYTVLDFRDLAKTARNRVVYEILRERRIKATVAKYRKAFARLAKNPKPKKPTEEEKNILAAVKLLPHKHTFKDLAGSLHIQTGQRDNIIKGLVAADAFFPKMEALFRKMGVPQELTRIALVESSFNLKAISKVGASGVWQFMPRSGKEFMTIDDRLDIDERISPLKSTVAAARLLARNRRILGSWQLAVTSYNHGLRGLMSVEDHEKHFSRVGRVFASCDLHRKTKARLGWASRNYYSEFIAVLHAEAYRHLFYGSSPRPPAKPIAYVRLDKPQSAATIAKKHGISIQEFHLYNPDVGNLEARLPRGFFVAIPSHQDDVVSLLRTIKIRPRFLQRTIVPASAAATRPKSS